jgi:hypothetical protein
MKHPILAIFIFLFSSALFAQNTVNNSNSTDNCEQLSLQILRINKQIESLDKRLEFINSKEIVDQNQVEAIASRKELMLSKETEWKQLQSQNCNPKNGYTPPNEALILKGEKIKVTKSEYENLSKERQSKIANNPNLYQIID